MNYVPARRRTVLPRVAFSAGSCDFWFAVLWACLSALVMLTIIGIPAALLGLFALATGSSTAWCALARAARQKRAVPCPYEAASWLLAAAAALLLAGCGQKGALYLPDKSAQVVTTAAATAGAVTVHPGAVDPRRALRRRSQPTRTDDSQTPK